MKTGEGLVEAHDVGCRAIAGQGRLKAIGTNNMNPPVPKRRRQMSPEPAGSVAGSGSLISDDILFFQILILLPVKFLARFQSVCKSWRATIRSTHFVRCHLERSRSRSLMLLVSRKYQSNPGKMDSQFVNIYSFQPGQSKIAKLILQKEFYSDGILLFSMPLHCDGLILIPYLSGEIFVCNPATKEFVKLPSRRRNVFLGNSAALGFDTWSGTYKVARHFIRSSVDKPQIDGEGTIREYSYGHEILTLGVGKEAWVWKATMDPPCPIKARTPICLPGFVYWSARHSLAGSGQVSSDVILRFSLHDETFTVHPNPPCRGSLSENVVLSELGGKLCCVHSASQWEIAIWLAEDGPILAWSLCCRVSLALPWNLLVYACASADQDKIFLSVDTCNLFKCDLRDGSLEKIVSMAHDVLYDHGDGTKFTTGALPIAPYMVPFVESLLRIAPL